MLRPICSHGDHQSTHGLGIELHHVTDDAGTEVLADIDPDGKMPAAQAEKVASDIVIAVNHHGALYAALKSVLRRHDILADMLRQEGRMTESMERANDKERELLERLAPSGR